jgi:hypothetical protein
MDRVRRSVGFEGFRAVTINHFIFYDVTPHSLVEFTDVSEHRIV